MRGGAAGRAGKAGSRAVRKRALTADSSSRWAGAITRTSEDQYRLAEQNLRAERSSLTARIRSIEARLAVPVGGKAGRARGYATTAERHAKTIRLQALRARLGRVQRQLDSGAVSVARGGKALLRKRNNLGGAGLTESQWRREWESSRLFLTADGEKDKAWGNETIRWNPDTGWLEVKLPAPLAHLANQPHGRYRLSATVEFGYRGDEVAAQASTGAVRYDITRCPHPSGPSRDRWYIDASWKAAPAPAASLDELRQHPVVAVDVNHGHLAVAVVAPDGNILGTPATIGLDLAGLPATTRDGHLRAVITGIIATANSTARMPSSSKISTSPKPAPKDANATAAGPPAAGGGAGSAARSPASPPPGSATGWSRWPATPGCRSSSSTPPIPPAGQPSTGSARCGSTTRRRPVTTRQRW